MDIYIGWGTLIVLIALSLLFYRVIFSILAFIVSLMIIVYIGIYEWWEERRSRRNLMRMEKKDYGN